MSLIDNYIKDATEMYPPSYLHSYWYIGTENTMEEGLDLLFKNLNRNGHILIDIEMFDHTAYSGVCYIVLYKALPKLEYLAYRARHRKQVNKIKYGVKV